MTNTPTPLSAEEIAELKLLMDEQITAMANHQTMMRFEGEIMDKVPRLISMVEALQIDQIVLDSMLGYLGIEDSDADPVDYLRMQSDTIEALRRQLAERDAEIERLNLALNNARVALKLATTKPLPGKITSKWANQEPKP